jgi:hypothetical protein
MKGKGWRDIDPLAPFKMFKEKDVLLILTFNSVMCTSLPSLFRRSPKLMKNDDRHTVLHRHHIDFHPPQADLQPLRNLPWTLFPREWRRVSPREYHQWTPYEPRLQDRGGTSEGCARWRSE